MTLFSQSSLNSNDLKCFINLKKTQKKKNTTKKHFKYIRDPGVFCYAEEQQKGSEEY